MRRLGEQERLLQDVGSQALTVGRHLQLLLVSGRLVVASGVVEMPLAMLWSGQAQPLVVVHPQAPACPHRYPWVALHAIPKVLQKYALLMTVVSKANDVFEVYSLACLDPTGEK